MDGIKLFLVVSMIVVLQFSCSAHAQSPAESAAKSTRWLALLHYQKTLSGTHQSAIDEPAFFYSPDGMTNPLSELHASHAAFVADVQQQCVFPARAAFLRQHLGALPHAHCPELDDFLSSVGAQSVSLIYASGYLGNPASMYGHVFLKFNGAGKSELLDNTFNYGARYPKDEHPLAYIVNGIFGGYDGYFANQKYHHQTLTYTSTELRDLWEYRLSFTPEEVVFLLKHLWELEQVPMTYYFFKQNCAYQIAYLLSMLSEVSYLPDYKGWVMPFDIIMVMEAEDESRIEAVTFHPSRQEELYRRYAQLSADEQTLLSELLQPGADLSSLLSSVSEDEAKRVIDTAFDYFAFIEQKNDDVSQTSALRETLVNARFSLPPGKSRFEYEPPVPPHEAQKTSLVQVSGFYNDESGAGAAFRFRANYYDLLSVNSGRIPFSELSTFDLWLTLSEESGLSLSELTLLRIVSLNAARSGLPGDSGMAWKLAAGYREMSLKGQQGAVYLDGFVGKSDRLSNDFVMYAGASASLTSKDNLGGYLAVGAELGGVALVSQDYATSLSVGHQRYINAPEEYRTYATWEQRFTNSKRFDIRTLLRFDKAAEFSVSLSHYF